MKPVYAVALRAGCALPLELFNVKPMGEPPEQIAVLNCTAVEETTYGFLRLVPAPAASDPPPGRSGAQTAPAMVPMALWVPAGAVAWMLQKEAPAAAGFLAPAP